MALRQKVWIDRDVQGVLIGRIVLYWAFALLYVGLGSLCFQYNQYPDWTLAEHGQALFSQFWPWLPSVILCLPLIVFDVIRLSNMFVGPIFRLRRHLAELNDDPNCRPLKFRKDDYWQDLAEPVQCLQAEILTLRFEVSKLRQQAGTNPAASQAAMATSIAEQVAKLAALDLAQRAPQPVKKVLPAMGALADPTPHPT